MSIGSSQAGVRSSDDEVFKALANRRRREMLDLLRDEPRTTGALCEAFPDLNRCTVMQHLGVLERAGLVAVRREGRLRWNYLDAVPIKRIHDRWIRGYAKHAAEVLDRLAAELGVQLASEEPG